MTFGKELSQFLRISYLLFYRRKKLQEYYDSSYNHKGSWDIIYRGSEAWRWTTPEQITAGAYTDFVSVNCFMVLEEIIRESMKQLLNILPSALLDVKAAVDVVSHDSLL